MDESRISADRWLRALSLPVESSALAIEATLGITYKTALLVKDRLREMPWLAAVQMPATRARMPHKRITAAMRRDLRARHRLGTVREVSPYRSTLVRSLRNARVLSRQATPEEVDLCLMRVSLFRVGQTLRALSL